MNILKLGHNFKGYAIVFALLTLCSLSSPLSALTTLPYITVSPPNPKLQFKTMGIVPGSLFKKPTPATAIDVARFARKQYFRAPMGSKEWQQIAIFVFRDEKASHAFRDFQQKRWGRRLKGSDFRKLQSLWPKTLVYYEFNKGKEIILYPSKQPDRWWRMKGKSLIATQVKAGR